jgi:inner membrane protein
MDNLTHSLIGAALGQAGLKRKTGLAMPALIIGANIPDIDAACLLWLQGMEHVGFRRGITHGPPAIVLLPLLLAGGLWWFDQWQERRGTRPDGRLPVNFKWLFLLSLIGCLSHPLFDWFNNYGVRLLEPFSSQWFYGDTLFIFDVWIIAALGLGIWLSLRRERAARRRIRETGTRPAKIALAATALYVLANLGISSMAVSSYPEAEDGSAQLVVANVPPLAFWQRDMLVGSRNSWRRVSFSLLGGYSDEAPLSRSGDCDVWPDTAALSVGNPALRAFLFWSRMPYVERDDGPKGARLRFRDARFSQWPVADRFSVVVPLAAVPAACETKIRASKPAPPLLPGVRPPSP